MPLDLKKKYPICTGGKNLIPTEDYREDEFSFDGIQDESAILLGEKLKEFCGLYKKFLNRLTVETMTETSIAAFRGQAQDLLDKGEEIKRLNQLDLPETFKRRNLNRLLLTYSQNRGAMPKEEEDDEIQSAGFSGK